MKPWLTQGGSTEVLHNGAGKGQVEGEITMTFTGQCFICGRNGNRLSDCHDAKQRERQASPKGSKSSTGATPSENGSQSSKGATGNCSQTKTHTDRRVRPNGSNVTSAAKLDTDSLRVFKCIAAQNQVSPPSSSAESQNRRRLRISQDVAALRER